MRRAFVLLQVIPFIVGCSSYRPIATDAEHVSFRTLAQEAARQDGKPVNLGHVIKALEEYRKTVLGALRERSSNYWDTSDVTATGAVGAVLGGLADKRGLLNTGLGIAGLGLTTSTRYKQEQQIDITLATLTRLDCSYGRLTSITPEVATFVRLSQDVGAIDALDSAPENAIRSIEGILAAHLASIYALKPINLAKADFLDFFNRYASAQDAAAASAAAARSANTASAQQIEAAVKRVRTLSVELEACTKLG